MPVALPAPAELNLTEQTRMICALRACLAERHGAACALIETHISFVLVCGSHAYKIKKALKTEFLDQSTHARRRHACQEELRLNRRLAPDLYLGIVCITGTVDAPELDGAGTDLECAVRMRAFGQEGLWDRLAANHTLETAQIDELVGILVPFHAAAAVAPRSGRLGSPAQVRAPVVETLDDLDRKTDSAADRAILSELRLFESESFVRLRAVMAQRLARGRIRECHGDLHLGNVTMVDGHSVVFDGIEFNDDLRWIDVINEVAFTAMDLHARGLTALAHRFVNGYLEASGDYDGVSLLRYYMVYRALVRAKVELLRAAQCVQPNGADSQQHSEAAHRRAAASSYLALALRLSRSACSAARPALMITHGYSGSGKSTLTQSLIEASGAIRIRADIERKRLVGMDPLDRRGDAAGVALYGPAMTAATYARLRRFAVIVLRAGFHAILDATFLRRQQRITARRLAAKWGVGFVILDFEVDAEVLRQRLRRRQALGRDASDADESVLAGQMRTSQPLRSDERMDV
ncbi:MAG TPA: AAA family ATPase, partial [Burkholderiaceae bacterium]|nr:AAA family ATPase [Burkholderiaceae bacterium]